MADDKKKSKLNPHAAAYTPCSYQATTVGSKRVVLIMGPPGVGKSTVGHKLAESFHGAFWSAAGALRKVQEEDAKRPFGSQGRSGVLWHDTLDALKGLDEFLSANKGPEVKGFFLDAQGRNTQQFFYLCNILRKHGLSPGQVLSLECGDDEKLIKEAGGADAKARLDQFRTQNQKRMAMLAQAKGLVHSVDASGPAEKTIELAKAEVQLLFDRPLAYSLPQLTEAPCLRPIEDVAEYNYVADWVSEKLSGGQARWPCSQAAAQLRAVKGDVINAREGGTVPSSRTHVVATKTDGTRFLIVYLPAYGDRAKGRFYLVPKHMEVVYTLKPRIGEQEHAVGEAPLLQQKGGVTSFAGDGELVRLKTGWGGLKGIGAQQYKFVLNDLLYFEPERPREHLTRQKQWDLKKRLQCVRRLGWPEEGQCDASASGVALCVKLYHGMENISELVKAVKDESEPYTCTGLLFKPTGKYMLWRDVDLAVWTTDKYNSVFLAAKQSGAGLELQLKDGTKVGECEADAETAASADGCVCQVVAVHGGKPSEGHTWKFMSVRPDVPAGVDKEGLDMYLSESAWVPSDVLVKQLCKVTMRRDGDDRDPRDKPRMHREESPQRAGYRGH
eukprot:TRINITY_DN1183_c0_g1_i2.p2 TRINITY_DN1183_c0_g1~~TRINITY_DN1183_c0_g1_i2.p2  ORF type:complete len:681 (+),score=243.49 TRINITY_DN1183_c0_g1_i2:207-2045(+)